MWGSCQAVALICVTVGLVSRMYACCRRQGSKYPAVLRHITAIRRLTGVSKSSQLGLMAGGRQNQGHTTCTKLHSLGQTHHPHHTRRGILTISRQACHPPVLAVAHSHGPSSPPSTATASAQEQPLPRSASIGIIGGGIAGLSCAMRLEQLGYNRVHVYDTGARGTGGRASSRIWPKGGQAVDHAAQFFVVDKNKDIIEGASNNSGTSSPQPVFGAQVKSWAQAGVIKEWKPERGLGRFVLNGADGANVVGNGSAGGGRVGDAPLRFEPLEDGVTRWVGGGDGYNGGGGAGGGTGGGDGSGDIGGIGGIAVAMEAALQTTEVVKNTWISPSSGLRRRGRSWVVQAGGQEQGQHDVIVIAHNGKCAHRITNGIPASTIHRLLEVRFGDRVRNDRVMTLNSLYSLLVEIEVTSSAPSADSTTTASGPAFDGAFVAGSNVLSWLASNTSKYKGAATSSTAGATSSSSAASRSGCHREVWTLLSTATFARDNKVPQELLPGTDTETRVTALMLDEAERLWKHRRPGIGGDGAFTHRVIDTKLQLWGAGVPINTWTSSDSRPYSWDAEHQIGIAGDWLAAASIQGAYISGRSLANQLAACHKISRGLDGRFTRGSGGLGEVGEPRRPQDVVRGGRRGQGRKQSVRGRGTERGRGGRGGGRGRRVAMETR